MYMDRSLISYKPRKGKLRYLFTRKNWNILRDAVKNKTYKKMDHEKNNIIYETYVDETDNAKYIPSENVRYSNKLRPLTQATVFNPLRTIDNLDYSENINLGEPVKVGTVEGDVKPPLLSRIGSNIMGRRLPPIEIPVERSPEMRITEKKYAGSKVNRRISSKRKNKRVKKTYKKTMYKI